jgi:hypothetical protein
MPADFYPVSKIQGNRYAKMYLSNYFNSLKLLDVNLFLAFQSLSFSSAEGFVVYCTDETFNS